ncbi:unnamed protein product [Caenorhabditis angaria]|uniref:Domain of unknown function DB domain-containing protein n=1 Tax=Caenorhabditis angaria TaxID=860376 RepID=A0A9P1IDH7_9PELO|nr:unnamed protein product [Caenorhabditis angaria]
MLGRRNQNWLVFWFLVCFVVDQSVSRIQRARPRKRTIISTKPSGFSLARIQQKFDDDYDSDDDSQHFQKSAVDSARRRDEVVNDAKCLQKCNNRLNIGMDMVNAHMAFGSIDVPSVVEKRDLELFCMLDYEHSQCIDECGYSVQFNLREYVCRNRFPEMLQNLPCYAKSAPVLKKYCRPRCGVYKPLTHSQEGYSSRCRQLLCDHTCTSFILKKVCPEEKGEKAADYLLEFTRLQVDYWMKDFLKTGRNLRIPASCEKLQCDNFKCQNEMKKRRRFKKLVHNNDENRGFLQ